MESSRENYIIKSHPYRFAVRTVPANHICTIYIGRTASKQACIEITVHWDDEGDFVAGLDNVRYDEGCPLKETLVLKKAFSSHPILSYRRSW